MKTTSTGAPEPPAGRSPMYRKARSSAAAIGGVGDGPRIRHAPPIGADMEGLVPNVMVGSRLPRRSRPCDRSGARIGLQGAPARDRAVPLRAFWARADAPRVPKRRVVRRESGGARSSLDGHVADGHPLSMESARTVLPVYSLTCPVPPAIRCGRSPPGSGPSPNPRPQLASMRTCSVRGRAAAGTGCEHVRHLAGADAEGERAERAVGAGVAVAADHRGPGSVSPISGPITLTSLLLAGERVQRCRNWAQFPPSAASWAAPRGPHQQARARAARRVGVNDPWWRPLRRADARAARARAAPRRLAAG